MDSPPWPLVDRTPPLGSDDVHVWQTSLDCDEKTISSLEALLAADERERASRFHFGRDRLRYVVGRGALRVLLGEYLSLAPLHVMLGANPFGKPFVAGEPSDRLLFNVSHSDGLALIAITRGREVGIDIEAERPDIAWRELAERYFASEENAELTALPEGEQRTAFYRCWTRKEAYVKAVGIGLQIPLDGFAVTLSPSSPPALIHTAHDPSQLRRWELRGLSPSPGV